MALKIFIALAGIYLFGLTVLTGLGLAVGIKKRVYWTSALIWPYFPLLSTFGFFYKQIKGKKHE